MKEYGLIILGVILGIMGCFIIQWSLLAAAWIEGFAIMAFAASETVSETY